MVPEMKFKWEEMSLVSSSSPSAFMATFLAPPPSWHSEDSNFNAGLIHFHCFGVCAFFSGLAFNLGLPSVSCLLVSVHMRRLHYAFRLCPCLPLSSLPFILASFFTMIYRLSTA